MGLIPVGSHFTIEKPPARNDLRLRKVIHDVK